MTEESAPPRKKSRKYYFRPNLLKLLLSLNLIWFLIHLFILLYQEHYESARNEFWYPYGYENHGYYDWTEFTIYIIGFMILSLIITLLFKQEETIEKKVSLEEMEPEIKRNENSCNYILKKKANHRILKGLLIAGVVLTGIYYLINASKAKAIATTEQPTLNTTNVNTPNIPTFLKEEVKRKTIKEEFLEIEQRWTKILNGKWEGSAYQYDIQDSWSILLYADFKKNKYKIKYPSLGCTGIWTNKIMAHNYIEFNEKILSGKNICNDGGLVRLTIIDNNTLEFKYYTSYSTELNSLGTLKKL